MDGLAERGWVYLPEFVPAAEELLRVAQDDVPWTDQMRARRTASMGVPYNYAGASYDENPWHPAVRALADRVGEAFAFEVTNCLMNRYTTGENTIGWHADDVEILAPATCIAIVSLGAPRTLQLRGGEGEPFSYTRLPLEHASLLVMSQALQLTHKHCIKREPGAGERISLTFRHLTHAPPPITTPRWGER